MATTAIEPTTHWSVDPDKTTVEFAVKTFWGLSTVHGSFHGFDGAYEIRPGGTTIELTIDADSLDTGNRTRDKHLRSDEFFQVAEHPHVRFTSSRVHEVGPGLLHLVGTLEAAGKTLSLEFPATVHGAGDAVQMEATTTVDQQEFGMSSGPLGMILRPVTLHVSARLARQ